MAGLTVYSSLPPAVQAYYDKRMLLMAKHSLVAYQFGQKDNTLPAERRTLPQGKGKTVYFTRYIPLAKQTTALTETITGGITRGSEKQLKSVETSATVAIWGDYVDISTIAQLTSIDPGIKSKVDILATQMSESIDYQVLKTICTGGYRLRADNDSTYQVEGTATSGTTTTIVDATNLTQADDAWNGGFVTVTAGTNYGLTRKVSDFANATGTLTVDTAFPAACDTTTQFRVTVGTGVAASDVVTTANIRRAKRQLGRNKALKMPNGYFVGILDPDLTYDFMGDSEWVNAATYKDKVESLYNGEIGKWMGIRFVESTQLYRESVAGVEQDGTGAVHVLPIIGREAYGLVDLEGQSGTIVIRQPHELGQPLNMSGTVGWQYGWTSLPLNGNWVVNLLCGATA